ncbi:MAG: hypothetical protein FWE53_04210 [Firmicutes bacterium]|nr:hypothetical protein [Bacillota bacterium]
MAKKKSEPAATEATEVKEVKVINHHFRPLSLLSGLIWLAAAILCFVLAVMVMGMGIGVLGDTSDLAVLFFGWVIILLYLGGAGLLGLLGVVLIIMGILQIVFCFSKNEKYKSQRGFYIAIMVLDGLLALLLALILIAMLAAETTADSTIIMLGWITMGLALMSFACCLADIIIFNKRVKKGRIVLPPPPVPLMIQRQQKASEEQIAKIEELYNNKTITAEEYIKMRNEAEGKK